MKTEEEERMNALITRSDAHLEAQTVEPGPMIWTTREGKRLPITEMKTSHLFNAMKMAFNHLAEIHGGQPIWFQHRYEDYMQKSSADPSRLAQMVLLMLVEIETRRDLPPAYEQPLKMIIAQIRDSQRLSEGTKQIR